MLNIISLILNFMNNFENQDFVLEEKTTRKYKAHSKEHRGILNWLFKNGYCSKQTFGDYLIHSYADKFPEKEFRGIKDKCLFIQEDFADFMDYVKKNFTRKYKQTN